MVPKENLRDTYRSRKVWPYTEKKKAIQTVWQRNQMLDLKEKYFKGSFISMFKWLWGPTGKETKYDKKMTLHKMSIKR